MTTASVAIEAGLSFEPAVIDEDHLGRMTLGDGRLEREILEIFVRQTTIMLGRIAVADPGCTAVAAHTLLGSARGIGAWRVASAAERLEYAANIRSKVDVEAAIDELKAAALEAGAAIGARLSEPARSRIL